MTAAFPQFFGIGDNCVDRYRDAPERPYPGGNVLNVVANWLMHGLRARYAGSVGDDADGAFIRAALRTLGDDGRYLRVVPGGVTGVSVIVMHGAEPEFVQEAYGVSGSPPLDEGLLAAVRETRACVHLSTNGQALSVARALRGAGAFLSCDFGYHLPEMDAAAREELLAALDAVFLSTGAASDRVVDKLVDGIRAAGPAVVLAGRGAGGVRGWIKNTRVARRPPAGPAPVDTLGAGDALIAGVLAALPAGPEAPDPLEQGLSWAATACSHRGAFRVADRDPCGRDDG